MIFVHAIVHYTNVGFYNLEIKRKCNIRLLNFIDLNSKCTNRKKILDEWTFIIFYRKFFQVSIIILIKLHLSYWSGRRGSNPQPSAWKADALPVELLPQTISYFIILNLN